METDYLLVVPKDRIRSNGPKIKHTRFSPEHHKILFHSLDNKVQEDATSREAVGSLSLEIFKGYLMWQLSIWL